MTYLLEDNGGLWKKKDIEILSSLIIKPTLDKPSYRIREDMELDLEIINNGRFKLDDILIDIPSPFGSRTKISLNREEKIFLSYQTIVPEELKDGIHHLEISATQNQSTITKKISFTIPRGIKGSC